MRALPFLSAILSLVVLVLPAKSAAASSQAGAAQAAAPKPGMFAERREIEALDRIADLFPFTTTARGKVITLSTDELFAPGGCRLQDGGLDLDRLGWALRQVDDHPIEVDGYTDSLGDRRENERLSLKRALAVRQYLVSHGVDASLVEARGLGSRHPVADNATEEGRAANRRIEIIIERRHAHPTRLLARREDCRADASPTGLCPAQGRPL